MENKQSAQGCEALQKGSGQFLPFVNQTLKHRIAVLCISVLLYQQGSYADGSIIHPLYRSDLAAKTQTKPKPTQHFGFDDQLTDSQSRWQFLGKGYRAYNPMLHRFMAQDSMSPFDKGGINGYIFSSNNPIMKFDPSGHFSGNLFLNVVGLIGGAFGAGVGLATGVGTAMGAVGIASGFFGIVAAAIGIKMSQEREDKTYSRVAFYAGVASTALDVISMSAFIYNYSNEIYDSIKASTEKYFFKLPKYSPKGAEEVMNHLDNEFEKRMNFAKYSDYAVDKNINEHVTYVMRNNSEYIDNLTKGEKIDNKQSLLDKYQSNISYDQGNYFGSIQTEEEIKTQIIYNYLVSKFKKAGLKS